MTKNTERPWPAYLFGGRVRTSTLVLIAAFFLVWWVYDTYQPEPEPPPGYVPDPNYTWVPRTGVQPPPWTPTWTPETTTPTTTTTETTPTESEGPEPSHGPPPPPPLPWPFGPATTTETAPEPTPEHTPSATLTTTPRGG